MHEAAEGSAGEQNPTRRWHAFCQYFGPTPKTDWCAGLILSMGCEASMGFVIAHELLHSRQWQERTLAEAVLCTLGYMHWSRSHHVHHQRVRPSLQPTDRLMPHLYRQIHATSLHISL